MTDAPPEPSGWPMPSDSAFIFIVVLVLAGYTIVGLSYWFGWRKSHRDDRRTR